MKQSLPAFVLLLLLTPLSHAQTITSTADFEALNDQMINVDIEQSLTQDELDLDREEEDLQREEKRLAQWRERLQKRKTWMTNVRNKLKTLKGDAKREYWHQAMKERHESFDHHPSEENWEAVEVRHQELQRKQENLHEQFNKRRDALWQQFDQLQQNQRERFENRQRGWEEKRGFIGSPQDAHPPMPPTFHDDGTIRPQPEFDGAGMPRAHQPPPRDQNPQEEFKDFLEQNPDMRGAIQEFQERHHVSIPDIPESDREAMKEKFLSEHPQFRERIPEARPPRRLPPPREKKEQGLFDKLQSNIFGRLHSLLGEGQGEAFRPRNKNRPLYRPPVYRKPSVNRISNQVRYRPLRRRSRERFRAAEQNPGREE